jgi:eukaryotic-like serine/threonine-protein kinase
VETPNNLHEKTETLPQSDPDPIVDSGAAPVTDAPASDSGAVDAGANGLTIGHIGRYALKQRLGEGGLGTVHAAYDPILSRTIAVKTLHLNVAEGDRAALDALFLNEARAAAGLNHPNIVTVYDAGLSEQGVYIAMERLRGRDLRQLLANGWHPDVAQAAQIVRRVADALSYAHSKGVIHCDIKPANIFMVGRTLPKVVDFGIARVANGQVIPALEGVVAGSPHYLAPEQLRGETIDRRCDVYSLGVVMYELLAHRKAFNGKTLSEIVDSVQHTTPPPAHEARTAVPAALSNIAARAMAREPQERYRSARQLSRELRDWLETEGELVPDDSAAAPARRNWPALASIGALAGAAVVATVLWLARPDAQQDTVGSTTAAPAAAPSPTPAPDPAATPGAAGGSTDPTSPLVAALDGPTPQRRGTDVRPATRPAADSTRAATRERQARNAPTSAKAAVAAPANVAPVNGVVQLAISPWGHIDVDGTNAGVTPPLSRLSLSVGEHVITVRNDDFPPHSTTVRVNADQPVVVRHRFGS